ncbi:MAG TPA: Rne/Rng family ribonuclease [Pyrinomonadaceae bacterium]|nr:Rne/Rng family ribonuclease [Pyrinomonadaceae bacterium]
MSKQLIVSVNGREKKIAIIEDDKVTEFYIERGEQHQGIVGNIYKGRVMRVLPGMQSAFVDIGLERDAFLYVSDFFDEEEEFERIVIDKSKKGTPDAEHAAAEEVAANRVEREQLIESTQERAEPLRAEEPAAVEPSEGSESGRRRGRRGRRRGRWEKGDEIITPSGRSEPQFDVPDTPFVAGDTSIERIVDEEETAAVNGEMFKDARLQERIFDQIHAVEFNMEDDFRTAEVGSLLSSGFGDDTFERVDDDSEEVEIEPIRSERRPVEAHVSSFVDDLSDEAPRQLNFQRVSDDEEEGVATAPVQATASKRPRKAAAKKRPTKSTTKAASKKKTTTKKASKKRGAANAPAQDASGETYADSEANLVEGQSRGEFATRRGGRRRRRSSKIKPSGSTTVDVEAPTDGLDDENGQTRFVEVEEEIEVAPLPPAQPAQLEPPQRPRGRNQRVSRDQRHRGGPRRERHQPAITDLLSEGQEILVQIAKEPIAKKGARITSHIALPGRFLVYMPTVEHVGVSRKIESDTERHRLRKLIQTLRAEEDVPSGGFIVRTAGVGISEKDLREDVRYLVRTWLDIRSAAEKSKAPSLVHRDLDLVQRLLRDQLSDDFESIRVDSEEEYQAIVEFVNRIQPKLVRRVKLYTKDQPILESYGVQTEIDKAIKPRVWLKSGGYLVINQTEALVAIDVNTGKFVGRGSGRLEDTITRTNLEAVDEIVRQIRLRDLGGIIVLDLIDMEERRNRQKVMQALQDALRNDKSPTKVLSFNDFGLVIMTRKRVKQSLERTLCSPCPYCQGAGLVKSPQTICYELLEDARRLAKELNGNSDNKQVTLRVNTDVAKALRSTERDVLIEIEDYLGPIDITSEATLHQEQFDFALI